MESLEGRVILVTGGATGIGRATCIGLSRYKAKVMLADVNEDEAQKTVSFIKQKYPNASVTAIKCDVGSPNDVTAMIAATVEKFGRLDGAVNCAGLAGDVAKITDYNDDGFDKLVKVNLKGVYLSMKHELIQMLRQEKSTHYSVVNISSVAGLKGARLSGPYTATKHGVIGLTKSAALEFARSGIRINAICPGFVLSPMTSHLAPEDTLEEKRFLSKIPMGRWGTTEEIANSILWLLSDVSSFTTGIAFNPDGGLACL